MYKGNLILLMALGLSASLPAFADYGRTADPNLRNFYMARQEVTITDDGPIINDQRTNGGAAQGGNGGMPGGMPSGLPKAGWQPYSSQIPSVRTSLPKVNNGVPPKMPAQPATPKGNRARAGNLKVHPTPWAATHTVKSYQAYKGYGGSLPAASGTGPAVGASSYSSSSSVKGDLLHWARTHH